MKKFAIGLGFALTILAGANAADAAAAVQIGTLTCNVSSGWGFVFGSSRDLHCTFRPTNGTPQHFTGTISKFGVDLGYTEGGVIIWGVFAPSSEENPSALAGDYAGATASATVAVGLGANVLVGGLKHSFALQPVSIEGNRGLNVAAGVAAIDLRAVS
jgi:hypothetical protein